MVPGAYLFHGLSSLTILYVACKSRVIYGPAVCGEKLLAEPSRGYIICGERYADDRYACATSM
jgi:hypothetical protein